MTERDSAARTAPRDVCNAESAVGHHCQRAPMHPMPHTDKHGNVFWDVAPVARAATTGADPLRWAAKTLDENNGTVRDDGLFVEVRVLKAHWEALRAEARAHPGEGEREAAIHAHGMGQEEGFRDGIEAAAKLVAARVARPGLGTMEAIAYRDEIVEAIRALAASSSGDDPRDANLAAAPAATAAMIRGAALEEAARVVEQCNIEGPYEAIGAAKRIRALADAEAPPSGDDEGALRRAAERLAINVVCARNEYDANPHCATSSVRQRLAALAEEAVALRALAAPTPDTGSRDA